MTTNEATELETNSWMVMATALGSLIGRVHNIGSKRSDGLAVYDACWVVIRPETYWIDPDVPSVRYTDQEAKKMGYVTSVEHRVHSGEHGTASYKNDVQLVEVEGDMTTDYIPINPNIDVMKTEIMMMKNSLIYVHEVENQDEISSYVDRLMGRSPMRMINDKES